MAIHSNSHQRPSYSSKMPFKLSSKTSINITLSGRTDENCSYSTFDAIKGNVNISAKCTTPFTVIEIALIGNVSSVVDAAGRSGALVGGESQATQQFLKLTQPIDFEQLGINDGMLQSGDYDVPFTFVVPSHLLPRACAHRADAAVREPHLRLPPTMGEKRVGLGFMTAPDFAPEGAKIEYAISVSIMDEHRSVAKSIKKIRIFPAADEEPPLSIENLPDQYVFRKEKALRKSLFGSKVGRLAISATQPSSFRLPAVDSGDCNPTTFARISLRFDPANANDSPPSLSQLNSKLLINSTWATTPRLSLQYQGFFGKRYDFRDISSDAITDELTLSPLQLSTTTSQWTQHLPSDHRASVVSSSSVFSDEVISPTKSSDLSLPFYTTTLTLPLSLPQGKHTWLPTFHSCLISRTYALSLTLHHSIGSSSSKTELIVPVQISRKHTQRAQAAIDLADTQAQAAMEAEETFIARSTLAVQTSPTDITRVGFPSTVGAVSMGVGHDNPPEYAGIGSNGPWNGRVVSDRRAWTRH